MIAFVAFALAQENREPVAWALRVDGSVSRGGYVALRAGEALEPGARLEIPNHAKVWVARGGRLEVWEGPVKMQILEEAVAATRDDGNRTTRSPHADVGETPFSGRITAALGSAQVYSALGIPVTAGAWARQDAMDGGALHTLYRDELATRLALVGLDRAAVEKVGLADSLPGGLGDQATLVEHYLALADGIPGSTVLLELPPTSLDRSSVGGAMVKRVGGELPHTLQADAELDKIRIYAQGMADALRRRGQQVYALVVPYANTVDNIVTRTARPDDGAENLHRVLTHLVSAQTVAFGYSQGATAVWRYIAQHGDSDGLDYAVMVATMGGADGLGADGVWSGRRGKMKDRGVASLAVVHQDDPARQVRGRNLVNLTPGLVNFAEGHGRLGEGDRSLHMGYFGPRSTPLAPGADPAVALAAGTHGYPTPYLAPMYDDLFSGRIEAPWARRGTWAFDAREELTGLAKGDYSTWRHDARVVADGYLPGGGGSANAGP